MSKWLNLFALAMVCLIALPAHADSIFNVTLTGDQEVPPVVTGGSGTAQLILSTDMLSLGIDVQFQDLLDVTTDAHIHCCAPLGATASVAVGFSSVGFPLGVTAGTFSHTFDLTDASIYTASFLGNSGGTAEGARTALLNAFNDSAAYVNIHSAFSPPGEIRGQIIPEPGSMSLIGLGVASVVALGIRRRQRAG